MLPYPMAQQLSVRWRMALCKHQATVLARARTHLSLAPTPAGAGSSRQRGRPSPPHALWPTGRCRWRKLHPC
eukprot:14066284-Alexandrium_andersonii.AAC.1